MKKYCPQCDERYDDGQLRYCLNDGVLLSLPDPYRLVGSTLENRYRIEALVGMGGFGAVYSAQQLGTGRAVAFKILKPDVAMTTPESVELFETEARTAARFEHENIVTIYDAGRTGDNFSYIAMEWLEGRPLDEELKARGRLSMDHTAEILRPVAAALAHAHARHVVHRDLKPGNVMLVKRSDALAQVKVVDFGIAKVLSSTVGSLISRSIGTPLYAAPEQTQYGARVDGRTDIYALGVMLYQMLTGRLPFYAPRAGDAAAQMRELARLKREGPPPLRQVLPDAPEALEALLIRMMATDPAQRPQRVSEVPALFEQACRELEPLPASPVTVLNETEAVAPTTVIRPEPPRLQPLPSVLPPAPTPNRAPKPTVSEAETRRQVLLPKPTPPSSVAPPVRRKSVGAIAATAFVLVALLGYGVWSALRETTTSSSPARLGVTGTTANSFTVDLGNGVKLEMVNLTGGKFTMGSNEYDDEKPPHEVTVGPFAIGQDEVTQAQWQALMGSNPSHFKGEQLPVEQVSWDDTQEFLKRLRSKTGEAGWRLPTEAEWEYAARAGTTGDYAGDLDAMAWYDKNAGSKTHPVGQKQPNAWGLYDMHGNVWEWVQDWYDKTYYSNSPATDPRGPSSGSARVFRGGGWISSANSCRAAIRFYFAPGDRDVNLGFRLLRTPR